MGFRNLLWALSNHGKRSRPFLLPYILQGPMVPHREPPPGKMPPPKKIPPGEDGEPIPPPPIPDDVPGEDEDDEEDDDRPPVN